MQTKSQKVLLSTRFFLQMGSRKILVNLDDGSCDGIYLVVVNDEHLRIGDALLGMDG